MKEQHHGQFNCGEEGRWDSRKCERANHEEAAREVRRIWIDPHSIAGVFDVHNAGPGKVHRVDITDGTVKAEDPAPPQFHPEHDGRHYVVSRRLTYYVDSEEEPTLQAQRLAKRSLDAFSDAWRNQVVELKVRDMESGEEREIATPPIQETRAIGR